MELQDYYRRQEKKHLISLKSPIEKDLKTICENLQIKIIGCLDNGRH